MFIFLFFFTKYTNIQEAAIIGNGNAFFVYLFIDH